MPLDAPLPSTSESVATICVSFAVELIQIVAATGPEIAYGASNAGVVNVADRSSLAWLSFSHVEPATRPAVHCVVEREQTPFTGIHGMVTVVSAVSAVGASEPAYSEWPPPGAEERYHDRYAVRVAG